MSLKYLSSPIKSRTLLSIFCGLLTLTACATVTYDSDKLLTSTPEAKWYSAPQPMQCVPFARNVSGIEIYGDAHTWWHQAKSKGREPRPSSVLVLAKTKKLRYGHLAVVKERVSPRKITVTHTNWGSDFDTRRVIYKSMLVEDISKKNDWSLLRFWNKDIDAFGLPYPAYGFVYSK